MTDRTLEDLNVETIEELITPDQLKAEMPLTPAVSETVLRIVAGALPPGVQAAS